MYQRDTRETVGHKGSLANAPQDRATDRTSRLRGMSYEAQVQALSPSSQGSAGVHAPTHEAATGGPGSGALGKVGGSVGGAREGFLKTHGSLLASVGLPDHVSDAATLQQSAKASIGGDTGGAVLGVKMTVTKNITNTSGAVIGMRGSQTIVYQHSDGRLILKNYEVNWQEDGVVENTAVPYEHPAAPAVFNIIPKVGGQKYPVNTDHPEQGIAIHAPGRSEGCILGDQKLIVDDLEARLNAGVPMTGEITSITDKRLKADRDAAPKAW